MLRAVSDETSEEDGADEWSEMSSGESVIRGIF